MNQPQVRRNNIIKTYTIPKDIVSTFESVCKKEARSYSKVVQRMMIRYCEGK